MADENVVEPPVTPADPLTPDHTVGSPPTDDSVPTLQRSQISIPRHQPRTTDWTGSLGRPLTPGAATWDASRPSTRDWLDWMRKALNKSSTISSPTSSPPCSKPSRARPETEHQVPQKAALPQPQQPQHVQPRTMTGYESKVSPQARRNGHRWKQHLPRQDRPSQGPERAGTLHRVQEHSVA